MASSLELQIRAYLKRSHRARGAQQIGRVALGTSVGRVRDENQDRLIHIEGARGKLASGVVSLTVIADGMGGMANGAAAAEIACAAFVSAYLCSTVPAADRRLTEAAMAADKAVYNELGGRGGATLVAVAKTSQLAFVVSIGDSRLYAFNRVAGVRLVTRDDTLKELLHREGAIAQHVDRGNQLVQFVGLGEGVEPHLYATEASAGDFLILTTDGAHSIGDDLIDRLCRANHEPNRLVEALLAVSSALGGTDNATVAVVAGLASTEMDENFGGVTIYPPSAGQFLVSLGVQAPSEKTINRVEEVVPASDDIVEGGKVEAVIDSEHPNTGRVLVRARRKKKKAPGVAPPKAGDDVLSFDFPKDN